MKKLLSLVFFVVGIISSIDAMEQPKDFDCVFSACRNEIVRYLDGKSFTALSLVSTLFCDICDSIPTKYIGRDFASIIEHKNKKLFNRFIVEMLEPGIGKEVYCNDTVKIYELSLNPSMHDFLGDCSLCCVHQGDKAVRCFWFWKSPELHENRPEAVYCTYFNIIECDDMVNRATKEYLKAACNAFDRADFWGSARWIKTSWDVSMEYRTGSGHGNFRLLDSIDSIDHVIKQCGKFMLLVSAARKNNIVAVCSILNSSIVPDAWVDRLMACTLYDLPFYNFKYKYPYIDRVLEKALDLMKK